MAEQSFTNIEQKHDNEDRSAKYLFLPRKSKLRKVLYTEITDTVDQTDWGKVLKKDWHVSPPEAVIAITGISHQFNIKNKRNLKKDLIEAVISTGSWIVTCGTESGVVQFIEDAIDDHVVLTTYNIPIVGILSKRVLDEIQPLKRVFKVKTNDKRKGITIHTTSTKETLDPNHTQFIVVEDPGITLPRSCASHECRNAFQSFLSKVEDADFKTDENNDELEMINNDKRKKSETKEKLPVVLVLIEGEIEAMETALRVLENDNHVVVINGSGGAANFLSTSYQRATSYNREPATLSDSVEELKELIYDCFEHDSEDLIDKAKYLATQCVKKHKLIHIYSLHENTTKVADLIQNAIFNKHKEYYKPKHAKGGNQRGLKDKTLLKINAVKKQLKLVEKWKRCDIAEKEIFIARNRTQLKDLQTLDEKRISKLPKKIKKVVDQVKERYKCLSEDFLNSYQQFMEVVAQFEEEGNKDEYFLALISSFNDLVEHVDHMPLVKHVKYKNQLMEIRKEYADLQTLQNKKMNDLERLDQIQRINKLTDNISLIMIKFMKKYDKITIKLGDSYAKFEKSVFQFEKVNKKPYFWALSQSFYQLLDHMPVDNHETIRKKFKKIEKEFDNEKILNEKEMTELENKIEKVMMKDSNNSEESFYNQFKDDVFKFKEVNKENYCMDKNKAKYFTNVSTSLTKVMERMEGEFGKYEQETFRMIITKFAEEYEKDTVSELFQSTLIANRTDFVILMLDKIEHMSAFVQGYLPNVFRLCVDSDDELAIQLIDQHWGKIRKTKEQIEKEEELQNETGKLKAKQKDLQNAEDELKETQKKLHNVTKELTAMQEELQNEKDELNAKSKRKKINEKQNEFEEITAREKKLNEVVKVNAKLKETIENQIEKKKITARLLEKKDRKNNKILSAVNNFIIDLFEDTEFKLYDFKGSELDVIYKDKPFHHLFVWAVLVNWREMAMIFWELETDHTCSALFASAILNELADKALFSKHMHLSVSLKENARHFETLACNVMTELYSTNRESALKTLVTKVGRYNSTPLKIAVSQKLNKFMAHTACQAQLNSIWSGDVAVYTPFWRIGMATFFPILLIQSIGFITMKRKYLTSKQIGPRLDQHADQNQNDNSNNKTGLFLRIFNVLYCVYRFYCAPVTKFFVYMIAYMTFVVIFAIFVLTDLYPLSESPPSLLELATWVWTLSLAIEEIRQILQTNKGSLLKNLTFWAKDVWNIFDITMYLMFLMSVVLRCLLRSDQFYFARMAYAVTLSMFILRSMHFFFIERFIGPKVVMIGRMFGDLGFFIALYALFVFSFGIMYQAVLFPNSVSSPWELLKDIVYLPYWQLYGKLHLNRIEGKEPSECTNNPQLYTNGTMERCAVNNQYNALMLAVYLVLTNILLVNILIAMFSQTFQTVQDNSEIIWKFHRYALVSEYYERPMFPIPIVIHLWRTAVFCYNTLQSPKKFGGAFVYDVKSEEIERLHIVEKIAYETFQSGPSFVRNRYDARNMMTDERDMNKEIDSTPTQHDIKELREEIHRMRESLTQDIRLLDYRRPVVANNPRR